MEVKKTTYDRDVDYQALINQAAARGDYSAAAKYEQQRNAKIAGENLGHAQTNKYASYLPKSYNGVEYNLGTDYMAKLNDAMRNGDYSAAAKYERQRNAKIDGENLGYGKTNITYSPQYDDEINSLFDKLLNRKGFNYDASADPLYQQYKELYTQQGKAAMQDTMGQAAALTGGYGSSYSQSVGQQQYDAYLQKLNEVVPELYGQAYEMYRNEGDDLRNQYQMYLNRDAQDYERYQNALAQYQAAQDNASQQIMAMLEMGANPSDGLISRSSLSDEYIAALRNYYAQQAASASSSGLGSGNRQYSSTKDYKVNSDGSISVKKVRQFNFDPDEGIYTWNGKSYNSTSALIAAMNDTELTDEDEEIIRRKFKEQTGKELPKKN